MRGKMKFGLILLLAVIAIPACGQGQPADKTIAVFGQAIHYLIWVRAGGGAAARIGEPQGRLVAGAGADGAEIPIAGSRPDRVRAIGQAAAGLQHSNVCGFSE